MRLARKRTALLLCVVLVVSLTDNLTLANVSAEGESAGLCPHHTEHTEECGYMEASEGRPCGHVHDGDCGYAQAPEGRPCSHVHDGDCGYVEAVEGQPCSHVHDGECGYVQAAEEISCDMNCVDSDGDGGADHAEGCSYTPASEGQPCGHVHDGECGYVEAVEGRPCSHIHDGECGYVEAVEGRPCSHVHDGECGYVEAAEGRPCAFVCEWCVTDWQWVDEEGILVWAEGAEETGVWRLSLPGVNESNPVTREDLEDMLPGAVTIETAAGSGTADLSWDFDSLPETAFFGGAFILTAKLPEEYALAEGVSALEVFLELGGAETLADKRKFLNQWSFISRDGTKMEYNENFEFEMTAAVTDLASQSRADVIKMLTDTILPQKIRGWTAVKDDGVFAEIPISWDEDQSEKMIETNTGQEYPAGPAAYQWGRVDIKWKDDSFPAQFADKLTFTLLAEIPTVTKGGDTYNIYVNSNNKADYELGGPGGDTRTNSKILSLKVTIRDINPADHVVTPANPENVKVNLFDYWVKDSGKKPDADHNGDILEKSDSHYHEEGGEGAISETATKYSTEGDWNLGINRGHFLLFGDGMIHAGLWNKGAGENCRYGRKYAGMEGIVKNVLDADGYPEINLAMANKILTDKIPTDHNYRDYTLIKDYALTGDHNGKQSTNSYGTPDNAYDSDNIKNLSDTLINLWETATGQTVENGTESLQYLFDPDLVNIPNTPDKIDKTSYTDVTGLFQLDEQGYYYYDMRKNFAEFSADGGNHFILYDRPATLRTDGDQSVGNFFPFNTGAEVFNGIDADDNLTSSVACSNNNMNHHLGMTVEVEFRQPANGRIGSGSASRPMSFQFAGDDDVWVFIDDVLVLDLGGIHSEIYGTVDFSTGDIYIGRAFDSKGIPDDPENPAHMVTHTTLLEEYRAAGREGATNWSGSTYASNTSHTLKMFYLERGNYDSSIALRFNLPPLLYQRIEKVDQNGQPLKGVDFELYPAEITAADDPDAIQCLYTDDSSVQQGNVFYVRQSAAGGSSPLVTLSTQADGSAVFLMADGSYFNFADRGDQYYILEETKAPDGYRRQPVPIVLHYNTANSMLSVANRWTTGAYACSVSNVTGAGNLTYGELKNGEITADGSPVSAEIQREGLVLAVPLLQKESDGSWLALYGGNLGGFGSEAVAGSAADWQRAVLLAALEQAQKGDTADWHLDWDDGNSRLYGMLYDLPGLANRYRVNNPDGDMHMVYGIISPDALAAMNIHETDADARYAALREYVRANTAGDTLQTILGIGDGFRFLVIDQFNRDFRSLIYIPNERRELRVLKVDQDGKPVPGAEFGLYGNPDCTGNPAASGVTDDEGMLIFSPTGDSSVKGQAKMEWADSVNTQYYLREISAPLGYHSNDTVIPVIVGTYSIYADAGDEKDGVSVMAGVGRLTQTMRQYAIGGEVDITLQDITAFMQLQPSGTFQPDGWEDATLEGTSVPRSMNLHFGINNVVDYGLHDEDGGKLYKPFFVTDTGFVRARVQQNYAALTGGQHGNMGTDARKENLRDTDLTNLFSLLNMVVVTDRTVNDTDTGQLTVSKYLEGGGLSDPDYTENFTFVLELMDEGGAPLAGSYEYYFYGEDKAGYVSNGQEMILHHDEAVTILGLPAGTRFTVTERQKTGWHAVSPYIISGTIVKDETALAEFTNSRDVPDVPDDTDDSDPPEELETPGEQRPPGEPGSPVGRSIPQTGVNWWPAWLLAVAGVLMLLAGIAEGLYDHGKEKK